MCPSNLLSSLRRSSRLVATLVLGTLAFSGGSASAEVKVPAMFSDGMVLQRGMKVPVWGTGRDGEKVTVSFAGQTLQTTAESGKWRVELAPLEASSQPADLSIAGENTLRFSDVLVGEVWVASGQSNMDFSLKHASTGSEAISKAGNPNLRLFKVVYRTAETPSSELEGKWDAASPESAANFSAVAYFFGRDLQRELNVPVGVIQTSWGGSPAEAWTASEDLDELPGWPQKMASLNASLKHPKAAEYRKKWGEWQVAFRKAKMAGEPSPKFNPRPPITPESMRWPTGLFNGMIAPLQPYAIRGVIWYQGESNSGNAPFYEVLFPKMISSWRRTWGQGDFPFLFVQLPPFRAGGANQTKGFADLREAQRKSLSVPNTAMVSIMDLGDPKDVHPTNKEPVGERLALAAQALAYDKPETIYSGPLFERAVLSNGGVEIHFTQVGSGLTLKGETLKGFEVAGPDGKYLPAEATIAGEVVKVSNRDVPSPSAVRYSDANVPHGNLWNKSGFPASPFRAADFSEKK